LYIQIGTLAGRKYLYWERPHRKGVSTHGKCREKKRKFMGLLAGQTKGLLGAYSWTPTTSPNFDEQKGLSSLRK